MEVESLRTIDFLKAWFGYFSVLKKCYDFDNSSILYVQRYQTKRVLDYVEKYGIHADKDRDIRHMKLVIKLIDLYLNDDFMKCTYEGSADIKEFFKAKDKWECRYHVNIKNWRRFVHDSPMSEESHDMQEIMKGELYERKVWHLIHLINEYFQEQWWD